MSDIEVNVESTNRQIDVNLVNPSAIDAATRERGPAGSSGILVSRRRSVARW